jgi:hypothetical protein
MWQIMVDYGKEIEKSRGHRKLPCGTPHPTCLTIEKLPLNKTFILDR